MLTNYPLPAYARLVTRLRDVLVLDLPSTDKLFTRTAIIFDEDADTRIIDVLFGLHVQNRHIRANVIALAETRGKITFWYGDKQTIGHSRRPMTDAANAVLFPFDKWLVEEPILAQMVDGVLDRDNLPARDLLRTVPERYSLGLVTK